MNRLHVVVLAAVVLGAGACRGVQRQSTADGLAQNIVRIHRFLLVNTDAGSSDAIPAATLLRLRLLADQKRLDLERMASIDDRGAVAEALESVTADADEDLLPFRDILADLASRLAGATPPQPDTLARIERLQARAEAVNASLNGELGEIGSPQATRGEPSRGRWRRYLDRVRRILQPPPLPELPREEVERGRHPAENFGEDLAPLEFVLTFDDGPSARHTPDVLAALRSADAKAMFFVVGDRFAARGRGGSPVLGPNAALLRDIVREGHVVANHTFSHALLTKLPPAKQAEEVETNFTLIEQATNARCTLFRPPYGSRPSQLLDSFAAKKRTSIMWTIDSMDWSDPVASSIVSRVLADARTRRRGIILMHDIHAQSAEALPKILSGLREMGAKFRTIQ